MDHKEFSQGAIIQEVKVPSQTVSVNGVEQVLQYTIQKFICCPSCNKTLFNLGNIPKNLYNEIDSDELYNKIKYCPHCGQKLSYDFDIIDSDDFS